MLDNLPHLNGDPLWSIIDQFRQDTRNDKMDLIVGVYRDESGKTPIMKVVEDAEIKLASLAESKSYRNLSGNLKFNDQIASFLLGQTIPLRRQCTIQTIGGTGALRLLADFIYSLSPEATVWNTEPGYVNHRPIMERAGLEVKSFPWIQKDGELDIETCLFGLKQAKQGDILLLHGCCHNPTGIDPTHAQWQQFVTLCKVKGIIPLIDLAYQGFAGTPDEDAAGLRLFAQQLDLVLVATSCSKNMGLYCERTGAAMIISPNEKNITDVRTLLEQITRTNYSMPPEHGAAIANLIFDNPERWLNELATYRERVKETRRKLSDSLKVLKAPPELQQIAQQNGMFSILPLSSKQVQELREKHAIYAVDTGRVNIAGLKQDQIEGFAKAILDVLGH